MSIERFSPVFPVRRFRALSGAATYNFDNVFNWSVFDAYRIDIFNFAVASATCSLTGRTSAPADLGAVHDFTNQSYTELGSLSGNGGFNAASVPLNSTTIAASTVGFSARIHLHSVGGALVFFQSRGASDNGAAGRTQNCSGHIKGLLAGFRLSSGANIAIASVNIWGAKAAGG